MQVRLLPHMSDPFPEKIVRERLDGAIRLLRGESAGYSLGDGGNGERSLLKKLRKTFMRGCGQDIVCASPCVHQSGSVPTDESQ